MTLVVCGKRLVRSKRLLSRKTDALSRILGEGGCFWVACRTRAASILLPLLVIGRLSNPA